MANRAIRAYNQTAADKPLDDLGITIPASSYIELTKYAGTPEISDSEELYTYVATAQVLLWVDGNLLNQQESADLLRPPLTGQIRHDTDLDSIGASDHHSNANDPNTDQKAALNGAGAISGANPLVSEGTFNAHADSTANPHDVTAAQTGAAASADLTNHVDDDDNPHSTTAAQVGAIPAGEKGAANGVATLDGGSKIPAAQIPAVALPEVHVVADEAARLALSVQEGDEAIQTDDGSHWIYDGSSWYQRTAGSGDVAGPASSTDNALARFDGSSGKVIQNSAVTVDDSGNISTPGTVDGRDVSDDGSALDSHIASTSNPHSTTKTHVGLSEVPNLKQNLAATVDPDADNDSTEGYAIGSKWINIVQDTVWFCVNASPSSAVWERAGGIASAAEYFEGYDNAGGYEIPASWADVALDTERRKDSPFAHTGSSAEVEVLETDVYLVFAKVTAKSTGGGRSQFDMRVSIYQGVSWSPLAGAVGTGYCRQATFGASTTDPLVLSLDAGDKLKIQVQEGSGGGPMNLVAGGSKLIICRLRGQKGDQGEQGLAGAGGVNVAKDDVNVDNTPHTRLNFTGDGVSAEDNDGDTVNINIPGGIDYQEQFEVFDDFVFRDPDHWSEGVAGGGDVDAIDGLGGQLRFTTGTADDDQAQLYYDNNVFSVAGNFDVTFRVRLVQVSSTCYLEFGIRPQLTLTDEVNFHRGEVGEGNNWVAEVKNGGVDTQADTGVAATDTGWHKFRMVSDGDDVKFYIDGSLVATLDTNLPTALLAPYLALINTDSGTAHEARWDWVHGKGDREA